MKRQIICIECAKRKPGNYSGEWWVRVHGFARGFKNGDFVCDQCNATIKRGEACVAQSFGLDRDPYQPWEADYIGVGEVGPGVVDGTVRVITLEDDGVTIKDVEEIPPK